MGKLTEEQAEHVRELYRRGDMKTGYIAKMFRITYATVMKVVRYQGAYKKRG
jgi:DNA invertase Pin-like site-specific DNA recombinase